MTKTTIILITPVLRTENIIYIAKNIVERFKSAKQVKPFWCLCFDKYHADISDKSISEIEFYLQKNKIDYKIYYEGDDKPENYGGTLMNFPLKDMKTRFFSEENPLVYVLDDDNIINKNFISFIEEKCLNNEYAWWLNMLDEYGAQRFSRHVDRLAYISGTGNNKGYKIIHRLASCDPSQLLIRLNNLLAVGGFGITRLYDYEFMNKIFANCAHLDEIMRYQGSVPWFPNNEFYLSCYHNGLVTNKNIRDAVKDLKENFSETREDSYIRIHTKNCNFNLELTNEEVLKILQDRLNDK